MVTLAVPPELREVFRYKAGQHLVVLHNHHGEAIRRTYSICAPATEQALRIGVRHVPGGAFSEFATTELRSGHFLQVLPPSGRFAVEPNAQRSNQYVAVAAGSGITPILSIVSTVLAAEPLSRVSLVYQNRTRQSTMFATELDELSYRYGDRAAVHHLLSRVPAASRRRISADVLTEIFPDRSAARTVAGWYLCGPEALMSLILEILLQWGVEEGRIHRELFFADPSLDTDSEQARPALDSTVEVRYAGETATTVVSSIGDPILTAALSAFPDLPFSCRNGVCTSCRAKLLEGEVIMDRRSGLDRAEIGAGYVLTCQAHPVTDTVVLDFDA